MSKEDCIELFRYKINLLAHDPDITSDFAKFVHAVGYLQSEIIMTLRNKNVPGKIRAEYNTALQRLRPNYQRYLYIKDPTCQLCDAPFSSYEDTTIDHIIPRALGGPNDVTNYQLAHAKCNVLKSNRPIKSFKELQNA